MTDHALLLLNLGSPASTEVADVRRYLNQFLMDPYVIDLPWPVRRLLVSLILFLVEVRLATRTIHVPLELLELEEMGWRKRQGRR